MFPEDYQRYLSISIESKPIFTGIMQPEIVWNDGKFIMFHV